MSQEIRKLHRQPVQFTNFPDTPPVDSSKNDSDEPQTPRQRRRRRRHDNSYVSISELLQQPLLRKRRRRRRNDSSPLNPLPQPAEVNSIPANQLPSSSLDDDVNSVRAELQEDFYHQQLSSADFSDESHDWDDSSFSSDYSHFLGLYE